MIAVAAFVLLVAWIAITCAARRESWGYVGEVPTRPPTEFELALFRASASFREFERVVFAELRPALERANRSMALFVEALKR